MQVSVFVGASIDGFIAEEDGGLEFLKPFEGEEHGFDEFYRTIDALVMGRLTYETVLGFGVWPYKGKRVIVLTHRPIDARHGETTHAGALAPLFAKLAAEGVRHIYLDGGMAIRQGLEEDLVDDMTISFVPVTLGAGRPLFGGRAHKTAWTQAAVRTYPKGLVQVGYERSTARREPS